MEGYHGGSLFVAAIAILALFSTAFTYGQAEGSVLFLAQVVLIGGFLNIAVVLAVAGDFVNYFNKKEAK